MKIGVTGSMQYTEKMLEICSELRKLGHEAFTSIYASSMAGKSDKQKEQLKLEQKYQDDAMRKDCEWIKDMDCLVVANYDKHGIKNYIGGNAFLEMGYAHILGQKIYLINPIPDVPYYGTEIIAMKPIVLNGDLGAIR